MRVTSTRGPHFLGQDSTPQGQASLSPSYRYHDHSAWESLDPINARDAWEASRALREEERHRGMEIERWSKRQRKDGREGERQVKAERWRERGREREDTEDKTNTEKWREGGKK